MRRATTNTGHSLFELMMTLALAALIFGLGLPSFAGLVADKRLRAETDALFHAVHLARKASVVRRRVITLCPSPDGARCDPDGDWSAGWIMFENIGRRATGVRSRNEKVLEYHVVDDRVTLSANRSSFSFRSTHLRATNGTITVCDRGRRADGRALIVSYTGRPRVSYETPRGAPVPCAD